MDTWLVDTVLGSGSCNWTLLCRAVVCCCCCGVLLRALLQGGCCSGSVGLQHSGAAQGVGEDTSGCRGIRRVFAHCTPLHPHVRSLPHTPSMPRAK
jgi:hypothetical protein